MIRKDAERSNANKRPKQPASSIVVAGPTYVGNNRQMLQEIRDSLIHLRKIPTDNCTSKQENMQIKTDLPGTAGSTVSSSASSTSSLSSHGQKSSLYRQKALAEIRNSLLPFANENGLSSGASTVSTISSTTTSGISSASGLSNASGSSSPCLVGDLQQNGIGGAAGLGLEKNQNPYDDDSASGIRGLKQSRVPYDISGLDYKLTGESQSNGLPKQMAGSLSGLSSKVIRKASFERDMHRMSPALEGSSTASTCSETQSLSSMQVRNLYEQRPTAQLMATSDMHMKAHLQVSRQYSPNFGMEPPPPPPPRLQGPPPTPPRGMTPPLPPTQLQSDFRLSQQAFMQANHQVQHMLKRISPAPQKTRPSQGITYSGPQSQSSTPQRGTSPVSVGRAPMVVQNSLQLQLNHQLQSALYNGGQLEPPPPYPIGSAQKLPSPPPYISSNRQSPTQLTPTPDYSATASAQQQKRSSPTIYPPLSMMNATGTSSLANSTSLKPAPLQAWSTRQPPPIMLSVKSTQVQKPVLQTAVAPAAPPMSNSSTPPPLNYMAAYQQKMVGESNSPSVNNFPAGAGNVYLSGSLPQYGNGTGIPVIPTTDPPSYASTIQALAAQRSGNGGYANYNSQLCASTTISSGSVGITTGVATGVTSLANPMEAQLRTTSPGSSSVTSLTGESTPSQTSSNNGNFQWKYSPMTAGDAPSSLADQPQRNSGSVYQGELDMPVNGRATGTVSTASSSNGTISNSGSDSSYKTAIQSPIPERKFTRNEDEDEEEEDSIETKVRNYSPQAFKFYMEQHVENVLKSHQQRLLRRRQLETEMAKVGLSEEAQCQMRKMLHQKESNYIRLKRAKMNKSMFVKIKSIGVGAFGEVALVRKLDTQHLYAMKTLRKEDVLKRNQVAHVKAERDILAEADNEWVVKLYYSFQDQENLYFVMDYIPGGDLMSLLIKMNIFQEPLARFYIAELVCAVESVHKMGFIHRDIKPDNILIDRDGHIKLTDFGLCTGFRWTHNSKYYQNGDHNRQDSMEPDENWTNDCQCNNLKPLERRWRREHQRCLAHSLVGTPNYIAPEVLMRTGYTQLCDWWSVGVILYEMLVGQPPFLANTPLETQYKVINWETTLKIPRKANLSPEAKDLTLKLCTGHDKRLGKNGPQEVKAHPYFAGVDFAGGIRRQQAPFTPTIRSPTDTSNFDPVDPDKLRPSDSGDMDEKGNSGYDNGKHPEHAFFEFTFRRFFDDGGHAYPTRLGMGLGETDSNQGPVYV